METIKNEVYCLSIKGKPGKTSEYKDLFKQRGFRWHSQRFNWFKFGENYDELKQDFDQLHSIMWGHLWADLFPISKKEKVDNGIPF